MQTVQMGPFKHTIDKGLDIRLMAFEIVFAHVHLFDIVHVSRMGLLDPAIEIKLLVLQGAKSVKLELKEVAMAQRNALKPRDNAVKSELEAYDRLLAALNEFIE